MERNQPVALCAAEKYEEDAIYDALAGLFASLGIGKEEIEGKRVVLKPNLLLGFSPEKCTTTHPAVVGAAARLMKEWGASRVLLAESPGGPFHLNSLRATYRACGMTAAAEKVGFELNEDLTACDLHFPEGERSKMFSVMRALTEADVIVDLCKLKTHSLAMMTGAVKNLFGAIPGIEKAQTHSRFPEEKDFFAMLIDLCLAVSKGKNLICVTDAVWGMEGEGPSGGIPRKFGFLGASRSPFCLDLACEAILGMRGEVQMLRMSAQRGLCPENADELTYPMEQPSRFAVDDVKRPQTSMKQKFDLIPKWMQPRPVVDRKLCMGCGSCARSCPQQTIRVKDGKAHIDKKNCIRCYCCQELCVFKAVKIHKSLPFRLLQR